MFACPAERWCFSVLHFTPADIAEVCGCVAVFSRKTWQYLSVLGSAEQTGREGAKHTVCVKSGVMVLGSSPCRSAPYIGLVGSKRVP